MNGLCYWEIPSRNVARSAAFYAKLFRWKMTPSGKDYMMFEAKSGLGGGIQKTQQAPGQGVMVYVEVKDIPATLARVVRLGGKVLKTKTEIGNDWGFWAAFKDPGGCSSICLWSRH
ncbi:VOC family protein [candidate division WOR-3 bacterium]|uniref:VOC family protein n=1 Tax=candidate division WOR-3 bacterium TaxID=2052148 RepID=A0A937XIR5_UNCW3|nr:VOC family protein [candidate division WOR-3 bacterium]